MSLGMIETDALARRIPELLASERSAGVEFLLHLAEFDRRRGWAEMSYPTLWEYCRRELKMLDCAIWRRVRSVSVLQRFPFAAEYLRDGRYEMSTLAMLHEILTPQNAGLVLDSGAGKSRSEIEALIADLRAPRPDVRESIRKLPAAPAPLPAPARHPGEPGLEFPRAENPDFVAGVDVAPLLLPSGVAAARQSAAAVVAPVRLPETRRPDFEALGNERWALKMTVGRGFREKLDQAREILSHAEPSGGVAAVLERALERVIAEHGRRVAKPVRRSRSSRGDTRRAAREARVGMEGPQRRAGEAPSREAASAIESGVAGTGGPHRPASVPGAGVVAETRRQREAVPIEVERAVRKRDGDCCAWRMRDGTPCGSRWQIELDHFVSPLHGGKNTVENMRLLCRAHNEQHARDVFGDDVVERYKRRGDSPERVARELEWDQEWSVSSPSR